jgi:hypothetical protein
MRVLIRKGPDADIYVLDFVKQKRVQVIELGVPGLKIIEILLVAEPHPHDGMGASPQDFAIDLTQQRLAGWRADNLNSFTGFDCRGIVDDDLRQLLHAGIYHGMPPISKTEIAGTCARRQRT